MKPNVIFDRAQIQHRVAQLADHISRDYRGRDIVLVGLLKGCVPFIADLGAQLEFIKESGDGVGDVYLDYMIVSSYHDKHEPGALRLERDIEFPVKGMHVIVVDDVADTCNTLAWVVNHLGKKEPASLRLCVCVSKPDKHRHEVQLDYVGFSQAGLPFLAGYGMDDAKKYRLMPDIFEVLPK